MNGMGYWFRAVCVFALMLAANTTMAAESTAKLEAENQDLRNRVANLENQIAEIKDMLQKQAMQVKHGDSVYRDVPKLPAKEEARGPVKLHDVVSSKHKGGIYGYIRFDAGYNSHHAAVDNLVFYALSEQTNQDDDEFIATANQSRIGFQSKGPEVGGWETEGKIEVDFYGSSTRENAMEPRMRHAYVSMYKPEWDFKILAGQTWDVFSPLVIPTLNFAVGGDAGNLALRRPQLRFEKGFRMTDHTKLKLETAFTRTIGENDPFDDATAGPLSDTGEDSGFPTWQGRASVTTPLFSNLKSTFGVSGHWGTEEYDLDNTGRDKHLDTWSVNFDFAVPLTKVWSIRGEIWHGQNLDTYYGGIGQGVNTTNQATIQATGGWGALCIHPMDPLRLTLGAGVDNPRDTDLNDGNRSMNTYAFGNILYDIHKDLQVGAEFGKWWTDYLNQSEASTERLQFSLTYKF